MLSFTLFLDCLGIQSLHRHNGDFLIKNADPKRFTLKLHLAQHES